MIDIKINISCYFTVVFYALLLLKKTKEVHTYFLEMSFDRMWNSL